MPGDPASPRGPPRPLQATWPASSGGGGLLEEPSTPELGELGGPWHTRFLRIPSMPGGCQRDWRRGRLVSAAGEARESAGSFSKGWRVSLDVSVCWLPRTPAFASLLQPWATVAAESSPGSLTHRRALWCARPAPPLASLRARSLGTLLTAGAHQLAPRVDGLGVTGP